MKRFAATFLICSFFLSLIPPQVAHAGWVQKEIKWQKSNRGGLDGTSIWVRDTTKTVIDFEAGLDTTSAFTLDDADVLPRGLVAPGIPEVNGIPTAMYAYLSDTTVAAYVVLATDSSAAGTASITTMTVNIDGRVGGFGAATTLARGWVKADSALVSSATVPPLITGNESVAIPIRTISPYGNIFRWSELRLRTTAGTGIMSAGVRVFLRYWRNDSSH